jgi:hypothetical protein
MVALPDELDKHLLADIEVVHVGVVTIEREHPERST